MDTSNTVIVTVNTAILFVAKGANFEVAMIGMLSLTESLL